MTIILPHRVYFSIFSRKILVNLWNFSFAPFYLPIFYVISNSVSVLSALTRCHWEKAYSLQMFVYTRMCVLFLWALLLIYLRTIQVQFVVVFSSSYICSWIICKIVVVIVIFSFVGNDTDISDTLSQYNCYWQKKIIFDILVCRYFLNQITRHPEISIRNASKSKTATYSITFSAGDSSNISKF